VTNRLKEVFSLSVRFCEHLDVRQAVIWSTFARRCDDSSICALASMNVLELLFVYQPAELSISAFSRLARALRRACDCEIVYCSGIIDANNRVPSSLDSLGNFEFSRFVLP
jgi:hypothetical protein